MSGSPYQDHSRIGHLFLVWAYSSRFSVQYTDSSCCSALAVSASCYQATTLLWCSASIRSTSALVLSVSRGAGAIWHSVCEKFQPELGATILKRLVCRRNCRPKPTMSVNMMAASFRVSVGRMLALSSGMERLSGTRPAVVKRRKPGVFLALGSPKE